MQGVDWIQCFCMRHKAGLQSAKFVGGECLTRLPSTSICSNVHLNRSIKPRNTVMKRYRSTKCFKILNQAKVVWGTQCKLKGLFGRHLNIWSMTPKCEQLEYAFCNSNIDFLGLSET